MVLDAWYSVGGVLQHGLFTNIAGALIKVLDNSKALGGKPLADLSQTRRTVVGVSFPVDGSQVRLVCNECHEVVTTITREQFKAGYVHLFPTVSRRTCRIRAKMPSVEGVSRQSRCSTSLRPDAA